MPTAAPPPAFPAHSLPPPARRQPWLPSRLRPRRTLGGQLSSCHCPARGHVSQAPRGGGLEPGRGLGSSRSAGRLLGRRGPASPCAVMGALLPFPPLPQPWWEDRGPLEGVLSQGRSPLPSDPGQGASCSPVSSAASVPSPARQNCRLLLKLQQWRLHRPARPPPPAGSTPDSVPAAPCGPGQQPLDAEGPPGVHGRAAQALPAPKDAALRPGPGTAATGPQEPRAAHRLGARGMADPSMLLWARGPSVSTPQAWGPAW